MESLQDLLEIARAKSASDVLVMVGDSPAMKVAGKWVRYDLPKLEDEYVQNITRGILQPAAWEALLRDREIDLSFALTPTTRVRCNAHFQRDHLALALRLVWPEIPSARQLGIPSQVIQMGECPHGLILISGATGSGKSTTMAAIAEHINTHKAAHIITIEDPIEFLYTNKRSIIEQREIGSDTASWQSGLRNVLRQAPDVILLGELRDLDSIAMALAAAETGHLVMASVHSSTAAGAISRIVDAFPPSQTGQARLQLSQSLRMVFAQQLVPGKVPDTRVLLYEILMGTTAVSNMIRSNEFEQIPNAISAGRAHGMIGFKQCKEELVAKRLIDDSLVHA